MRRVLLLVESNSAVGRGITIGVWRSRRGLDNFRVVRQDVWPLWRTTVEAFDGDGIIARVRSTEVVRALEAKGLPVVDVLGTVAEGRFPVVTVNDRAIGRIGAGHLREMGHTRFGFIQSTGQTWAAERRRGFEAELAPYQTSVLDVRWTESSTSPPEVEKWLASLPRPIGVMACNDWTATLLLSHCVGHGIAVPEAVSILGADNDDMFCSMSEVPLSSVQTDHRRIGYEAAALLDRLMRGAPPPPGPVQIPPDGVAVRASTDVVAVDDDVVASALAFIRDRACSEIDVDDIARHAGLSRTPLQRRFREALGRSIHDEVVRLRLERAKRLLSETELTIPVIADRIGMQSQSSLCRLFRQKLGTTPARYRRDGKIQTRGR
jgi:LacI family transcriptional regulator